MVVYKRANEEPKSDHSEHKVEKMDLRPAVVFLLVLYLSTAAGMLQLFVTSAQA